MIFKDEEKLSPEYVPSRLVHREEELKLLKSFYSSLLSGGEAYHVRSLIVGSVGTGKTSLAKLFGQTMERESIGRGQRIIYVHINCRINRSLFSVLHRVAYQVGAGTPKRGYSDPEIMESVLAALSRAGAHLILCLDEADILIAEEGGEPIYFLSRSGEDNDLGRRVALLMILRDPDYLERLDRQTRSSLGNSIIHLKEYGRDQLLDILKYRASESFHKGVLDDEVLEFIADIGAERGDARYTLDLLWRSGKFAEAEGVQRITAEHVRKAVASVYPTIRRENLAYLSQDEYITLLACTRTLLGGRTNAASMDVYETYKLLCEEKNIPQKGYTTFWNNLQQLQDLGFVRITVQSGGAKGRRSLISLPNIPVNLLEEELSKGLKHLSSLRP
jgi:cell division control protein 6